MFERREKNPDAYLVQTLVFIPFVVFLVVLEETGENFFLLFIDI